MLAADRRFRAQNKSPGEEDGRHGGLREQGGDPAGMGTRSGNEEGNEYEIGILAGWRDGSGIGKSRDRG
jgi:hypothetical protein